MEVLRTKHGANNGLFSHCSVRLHQIVRYLNKHRKLPGVVDSKDQFQLYQDNPGMDIAQVLFIEQGASIPYRHRIDYFHAKQFTNYKLLSLSDLLPLVEKYFTVSEPIAQRKRELTTEYGLDFDKTIGVIYRGNDKITETTLPPYEAFLEKGRQLLAEDKDVRFLVQTDEQEFRDTFCRQFPGAIYFKSLPAIPRDSGKSIVPTESHRLAFALEFIAAVQCLSQCRRLIIGSGNVDIWTIFFRGHTEGVYQFLKGRFVDRDNVPMGRLVMKARRYFGKIGWAYRWIGRRYFGFKPV